MKNHPLIYFEYFTIDPEKGYARNDAWGTEREMEKNSKVHEMTKLDGKFFIWGNSYIDENNINFYHFYQIDLKTLRKKGKAKMAYVSNLVVGLDGMVREIQDGFKCNRIDKAPQFVQ